MLPLQWLLLLQLGAATNSAWTIDQRANAAAAAAATAAAPLPTAHGLKTEELMPVLLHAMMAMVVPTIYGLKMDEMMRLQQLQQLLPP